MDSARTRHLRPNTIAPPKSPGLWRFSSFRWTSSEEELVHILQVLSSRPRMAQWHGFGVPGLSRGLESWWLQITQVVKKKEPLGEYPLCLCPRILDDRSRGLLRFGWRQKINYPRQTLKKATAFIFPDNKTRGVKEHISSPHQFPLPIPIL